MDRNATRQASGGGEIGCAPAGRASTHAAPWAPCTISGNRSIPRRPTPCARRSTTPGGTWRHRATFSAHAFRLIGRAKGSPSASPTWCNVGNAIPTISPRMRSPIWRGALPHEDNGVETRHARFAPKAPELLRCREMTRKALPNPCAAANLQQNVAGPARSGHDRQTCEYRLTE